MRSVDFQCELLPRALFQALQFKASLISPNSYKRFIIMQNNHQRKIPLFASKTSNSSEIAIDRNVFVSNWFYLFFLLLFTSRTRFCAAELFSQKLNNHSYTSITKNGYWSDFCIEAVEIAGAGANTMDL